MIRVEQADLPAGVWAMAHRDERGNLVIEVNRRLPSRLRSYAARMMRRAARRSGWAPGLLPLLPAALRLPATLHLPAGASRPLRMAAAGMTTAGMSAAIVLAPAVTGQAPARPPGLRHARRPDSAVLAVPVTRPAGRHRRAPAPHRAAVPANVPPPHSPPGAAGPLGSSPVPGISVQARTKPLRLGRHEIPPVNLGAAVPPLTLPAGLPPLPQVRACLDLRVISACAGISQQAG